MNASQPSLSIVVPMYNRERFVGRLIDSCLSQNDPDFEIIVVDDKSTDDSVNAVLAYTDPRIRLVRHDVNRGVCPARNSGIDAARGDWVVLIDSDDELLPGALQAIRRRISTARPEIARLVFMYELDQGGHSPQPSLTDEIWDYAGYIRWASRLQGAGDFCNVVRRDAFRVVRYPTGQALEASFHLDFAQHFHTQACPEVVGVIHSDAPNRSLKEIDRQSTAKAADRAAEMAEQLTRHGEALQRWAPQMYRKQRIALATVFFSAGQRRRGLQAAMQVLKERPLSADLWVRIAAGVCGPRAISHLKALKRRLAV